MNKPIAYFGYSKTGSTVNFTSTSLNNPTTYLWEFGDGNTSIIKNPTHTYTELGFFTVKLFVNNTEGESEMSLYIIIDDTTDTKQMFISNIMVMVDQYIPTTLLTEINFIEKATLVNKWQLYLQPLLDEPYKVEIEDTFNENKWNLLANILIAQLVAYDLTVQAANQFISSSMTTGGSIVDTETGQGEQQIKSIETGPAKTEWYEDKTSENIKNLADAVSNATRVGGAIDLMKESICMMAKRISIYLPICSPIDVGVIPRVFGSCKKGKHNANPFGVTRRMR